MTLRPILSLFFPCFLAVVLFFSFSAAAATINNIRTGTHPDKLRLVLEMDRAADFRVSLADSPKRLIVDLPDAALAGSVPRMIGRASIGGVEENDGRVLFSLQEPVKVLSAFMLPAGNNAPDRLVIDYQRIGNAEFSRAMKETLGTLTRPFKTTDILFAPPVKPDRAAPKVETTNDIYTIVIDAGHGGEDPGAVGVRGIKEKNITLAAARELARQLEATGRYKTVLTRANDRFLKLAERVAVARRVKADLFVSLHADMSPGSHDVDGLSIYTLSDKASDEQTERLAARENKADLIAGVDLSHENPDVANILIDLALRENMNRSRFLAGRVVSAMSQNNVQMLQGPHRYAGFAVLKAPDVPSVLVEMGFLSNPAEAKRLQEQDYRAHLMRSLVRGLDAYFAQIEKNKRL